MTEKLSLLLLGAGNMGGALLQSWAPGMDPERSAIVDPNPSDTVVQVASDYDLTINPETDDQGYDYCILAVKPQMFADVLPTLNWPDMDKTVFVSIAAGVTIQSIQDMLKSQLDAAKVIRTMPNLPAAVGQGATLLTSLDDVTEEERDTVEALFDAAGSTVWCETEDDLDALMGVSGCGPAFVFLLVEALEEAAITAGAEPGDARRLAEATVLGSAMHLARDGRPGSELREAVTSKGGTTAAALSVLNDPDRGFKPLMVEAVKKAYDRAKELAGEG